MGAIPTPLPPPEGSMAEDYAYSITTENLDLLSNATKSSLLAVSNLGSSITSKINNTLDLIEAIGNEEAFLLDATVLNNLANNQTSSAFTVLNTGSSSHVSIIVILGPITPTDAVPTIVIYGGDAAYSLTVSSIGSSKRLKFNNIPKAFVGSFTIRNNTGVAFASYGNSVVVVPI